jgi:hypothetical protein
MNETRNPSHPYDPNSPGNGSDVPWTTSEPQQGAPYPPLPVGGEMAAPAAAGLPKDTVHGAHDTPDRHADRADPGVRQAGDSVSAATETLHAHTEQLRETGDEWVEGVRSTVRSNPLASVAAALALGAVIARVSR